MGISIPDNTSLLQGNRHGEMLKILIIPLMVLLQQGEHSTFTGIAFINGTDSLKVFVRMDYELFLRDYQQTVFDDLGIGYLQSLKPFPQDMANNYLNSKLKIFDGRKEITGKLLYMEEDDGKVIFNMLYRVDRKLKGITVRNTFLTGLFSDATNLIIVHDKRTELSAEFTSGYIQETFTFR